MGLLPSELHGNNRYLLVTCTEIAHLTDEMQLIRAQEMSIAPTLDDFEQMAARAYAGLPAEFRTLTEGVVIKIEDWPTDEVLQTMGARTPYDILGLFDGIGRTQSSATPWTGQMPNMIWLYRQPILEYWRTHDEELEHIVSHVLIHEIGHHFGLSDDDMERVERGETL